MILALLSMVVVHTLLHRHGVVVVKVCNRWTGLAGSTDDEGLHVSETKLEVYRALGRSGILSSRDICASAKWYRWSFFEFCGKYALIRQRYPRRAEALDRRTAMHSKEIMGVTVEGIMCLQSCVWRPLLDSGACRGD